jgi:hypothetical protein
MFLTPLFSKLIELITDSEIKPFSLQLTPISLEPFKRNYKGTVKASQNYFMEGKGCYDSAYCQNEQWLMKRREVGVGR